jgi:probable rRNA maturation factor
VGVSFEGVRVPLSRQRVRQITQRVLRAERVKHALVSVTFMATRAIRALNRRHLKRDRDTDVISFGFQQGGRNASLVGDIYIAPDVARRTARENGVTVTEELTRLVVHGTLHAVGHDHPERDREKSAMWKRQESLVRRLAK